LNINFKTILYIIAVILLLIITIGEITPYLMNAGVTVLYYLGIIINLLMVTLLGVLLGGCWTDVSPGHVGLRVWKRGDMAGKIEVLRVGRHSWAWRADDTFFPTYKQNYVWTKDSSEGSKHDQSITFPIEGLEINIDVGIEFSVIEDEVGTIYSEYRQSLQGIADGVIRNYVRNSILNQVRKYKSMERFISENHISELISNVQDDVRDYFKSRGIEISQIYLVGDPRYPRTVVKSIEAKIKATQQAIQRENELREAEAGARKKVARARATAEANKLLESSLTDKIISRLWIEKWNGELPSVMSGDSSSFLLNIKNKED